LSLISPLVTAPGAARQVGIWPRRPAKNPSLSGALSQIVLVREARLLNYVQHLGFQTMGVLKRVENELVRPLARWARPSRRVNLGGIDIRYRSELDGGGRDFGQEFIPFLKSRGMPKQKRVFEWCCGPAFIGFSMLGNGLCETLCLSDINPAAVASCRNTVRTNNLGDRVSVYHSDNLKNIPPAERWNLVVSNPPHFVDQYEGDIRAHDPDWQIHKTFFATVGDHLAEDGVIVLQENNRGSTVETFRSMIDRSGLDILFTHADYPTLTKESSFYFIGIGRQERRQPNWT
jgi:predicted RNA methylase